MAKILIAGGGGYIGSHTAISLIENGHEVVVVDNFINSYPQAIDRVVQITGKKVQVIEADLRDMHQLRSRLSSIHDIQGVIHFAALKAVGESTEKPLLYHQNNIQSLLNILEIVKERGINNFIFSSSCTVYGQATDLPVTEKSPIREAESPYGRTKQIGEMILEDMALYSEIQVISLRYFNPAGAHPSGLLGEAPRVKALNLVPVITETAAGKRSECMVFGDDYDTRDGSCVRDYIHVLDLADAHTKAVEYLLTGQQEHSYEVFNLGIGEGVTVLEAIKAFEKVSDIKLNFRIGPRRPGDVISIYANNDRAFQRLQWRPRYTIEDIMQTAWLWEQRRDF